MPARGKRPNLEDGIVAVVEFLLLGILAWAGWDVFAWFHPGWVLVNPLQVYGLLLAVVVVVILASEVKDS